MGMIIRVAFNNQNWAGKCKNASGENFFKCSQSKYNTGYKLDEEGNCLAECWESILCTKYSWKSTIGNFDREKAMGDVFFVYPNSDNLLVLWGKSRVEKAVNSNVYFEEFKPMQQERWRIVIPKDILGQNWAQGTFRYIDFQIEAKLNDLIESFDDPIETEITDEEGKLLLKKHLIKERSNRLVVAFKQSLSSYKCWVCGFNFEETYGQIGTRFIEAHHIKPVSSLKEGEIVSTKDLVAVCSNCHRMIHRENPLLDYKKLIEMIKK